MVAAGFHFYTSWLALVVWLLVGWQHRTVDPRCLKKRSPRYLGGPRKEQEVAYQKRQFVRFSLNQHKANKKKLQEMIDAGSRYGSGGMAV